ncbi:MAG: hypothetical protein ACXWCY_21020 [Burkholderiales bacterium]
MQQTFYVEGPVMWDAKDRLDADLQYAIRMVRLKYATVEQAAVICGLEVAALRAHLADVESRAELVKNEKPSYALTAVSQTSSRAPKID